MHAPTALPTPTDLLTVAAALGLRIDLSKPLDQPLASNALRHALHLWLIAQRIIEEQSDDTPTEAEIMQLAQEADRTRPWSDPAIAAGVFGKPDSAKGNLAPPIAVTEDAIRIALKKWLGDLGTAAFYLGKELGVSTATAEALKCLIDEARASPTASPPSTIRERRNLAKRLAHCFAPQSGEFTKLFEELLKRAQKHGESKSKPVQSKPAHPSTKFASPSTK